MSESGEPVRPRPYASYETRQDVAAAFAARRELGPEFDDHIAAGLAERVEQLAAYRTAELQQATQAGTHAERMERSAATTRFVLGIISLGAGIPTTAIAGSYAGLSGIAVAWLGIVGVNIANSLGGRRRPR